MTSILRLLIPALMLTTIAACTSDPGGFANSAPRVFEDPQKAQAAARRTARNKFYRGSRSGSRSN